MPDYPYFALVHRAATRPPADVWPIGLREPPPTSPVPLLALDADAELDLQAAFPGAFTSVGYDRALDYARPPDPPLEPAESDWIAAALSNRPGS